MVFHEKSECGYRSYKSSEAMSLMNSSNNEALHLSDMHLIEHCPSSLILLVRNAPQQSRQKLWPHRMDGTPPPSGSARVSKQTPHRLSGSGAVVDGAGEAPRRAFFRVYGPLRLFKPFSTPPEELGPLVDLPGLGRDTFTVGFTSISTSTSSCIGSPTTARTSDGDSVNWSMSFSRFQR